MIDRFDKVTGEPTFLCSDFYLTSVLYYVSILAY